MNEQNINCSMVLSPFVPLISSFLQIINLALYTSLHTNFYLWLHIILFIWSCLHLWLFPYLIVLIQEPEYINHPGPESCSFAYTIQQVWQKWNRLEKPQNCPPSQVFCIFSNITKIPTLCIIFAIEFLDINIYKIYTKSLIDACKKIGKYVAFCFKPLQKWIN